MHLPQEMIATILNLVLTDNCKKLQLLGLQGTMKRLIQSRPGNGHKRLLGGAKHISVRCPDSHDH